jgi:hypothetical protein
MLEMRRRRRRRVRLLRPLSRFEKLDGWISISIIEGVEQYSIKLTLDVTQTTLALSIPRLATDSPTASSAITLS